MSKVIKKNLRNQSNPTAGRMLALHRTDSGLFLATLYTRLIYTGSDPLVSSQF